MLDGVKVPKEFEAVFEKAEKFVSKYFSERRETPSEGTIEIFADIAQNKIPMLTSASLANRGIAQYRMGLAESMYRSTRAWLMEAMTADEDEHTGNDELPGAQTTQDARLACVHAAN